MSTSAIGMRRSGGSMEGCGVLLQHAEVLDMQDEVRADGSKCPKTGIQDSLANHVTLNYH